MKHTATKVLVCLAAVATFFWAIMSLVSNAVTGGDVTGSLKVVMWYMMIGSVLFGLLSVAAVLRVVVKDKANGVTKALFGMAAAGAFVYTLLLIINIAPQITALFSAETWKQSGVIVTLAERLLYAVYGVLLLVLSVGVLRGNTKRHRELSKITAGCVCLLLVPYFFQYFGVGLNLVLSVGTVALLTILTLCQACVVYGAFVPSEG